MKLFTGPILLDLMSKISDWLLGLISSAVLYFYENGASLYDSCIFQALHVLTRSPLAVASGGVNTALSSLTDIFKVLGLELCALCFIAGWVLEANDINKDFRFENILNRIIKFGLSTTLVSNCSVIMAKVNEIGCSMANAVANGANSSGAGYYIGASENGLTLTQDYTGAKDALAAYMYTEAGGEREFLSDFDLGQGLGAFFLSIAFAGICIACGMLIIYTAYIRFFKILLCIPYAGLAFGTFAGGHQIGRTSDSYIRYIIAQQMQAVTMILALVLAGTILNAGTAANLFGNDSLWLRLLCDIFMCVCALGAVKSSEQITERALGLH